MNVNSRRLTARCRGYVSAETFALPDRVLPPTIRILRYFAPVDRNWAATRTRSPVRYERRPNGITICDRLSHDSPTTTGRCHKTIGCSVLASTTSSLEMQRSAIKETIMKIVVIGGSGLIGSKLVTKLREHGHEAIAASPSSGVNSLTARLEETRFESWLSKPISKIPSANQPTVRTATANKL